MKTLKLILPDFWASSLINGDDTGLEDEDHKAMDAFEASMVKEYGQCWTLDCSAEPSFEKYHDARPFGVLACNCLEYTFDITPGFNP
jgi:hypothetical protein